MTSVWHWPQILQEQRHWSLTQVAQPQEEPVTLTEAKTHLRVGHSDDDAYITALITATRQAAEEFTQRAFVTQKLRLTLDAFQYYIFLPRPPLVSVESIKYVDPNGDLITLDPSLYQVDDAAEPGRLFAAYGQVWPPTRYQLAAVTIDYTAGFGDASAVLASIKQAMLMMMGTLYDNRQDYVDLRTSPMPITSQTLLWPYRMIYDM